MFASDPNDALIPVFASSPESKDAVQIGTGIFVEFQSMPFLFTAAHVTDKSAFGALMVPTPEGVVELEGYVAHVDLPPKYSRDDDSVDIAYWRLSSRFARLLCGYFRPLP